MADKPKTLNLEGVTSIIDVKALTLLFDRDHAGVAANDAPDMPDFTKLTIIDEITHSTETFDFVHGIIIDDSADDIDPAIVAQFKRIEEQTLRELDRDLTKITNSSDYDLNKNLLKFNTMSRAAEKLTKRIVESEQGPRYASVYNNIGQIKRSQYELALNEGIDLNREWLSISWFDKSELDIFSTLLNAIKLAFPTKVVSGSWSIPGISGVTDFILRHKEIYKVSTEQAKVLNTAYAQLGSIVLRRYVRLEKILDNEKSYRVYSESLIELMNEEKDCLQLLASEYLKISGIFGNKIAKQNSVALNPMAKACGDIVRNSMMGGGSSSSS